MVALALTRRSVSPILIKGGEAPPVMISVYDSLTRTPGQGEFTCCTREHRMMVKDDSLKSIPCDRASIGSVTLKMVRAKSTELRARGEIDESRLWQSLTTHFMKGLSSEEMTTLEPAASVDAFLRQYCMNDDEMGGVQSGITALFLSVLAGNAVVVRELARRTPSAVTIQVTCEFRALSITAGYSPLHAAATFCPAHHAEIISTLLEHGADPNILCGKARVPPLYCAASTRNIEGLNALIACGIDIDKGIGVNSDTALGGAARFGNLAIVDSLLAAHANPNHVNPSSSDRD